MKNALKVVIILISILLIAYNANEMKAFGSEFITTVVILRATEYPHSSAMLHQPRREPGRPAGARADLIPRHAIARRPDLIARRMP
jgi:hypothetical protein